MIELTTKPAKLGSSLNVRTQKHGEENVSAIDLTVKDIALTRPEFNELLGDAHAFNRYFLDEKGFYRPADPQVKPRKLTDAYQGATVTLTLGFNGVGAKIELEDVKLKNLTFEPLAGGVVNFALQLQVVPTEKQIGQLGHHLSREVQISIEGGVLIEPDEAQGDLELSDPDAGDDQATPAKRTRKTSSRAPVH